MSFLETVRTAKQTRPRRTVIYGVHGIGKSTWASQWPNPVFIPTEDGLADIDVPAFPLAETLKDAWGPLLELSGNTEHGFQTVVLDSVDWLEKLIWQTVCAKHDVDNISEIGYGRGYAEAAGKFANYLQSLSNCRDAGLHCVIVAHSAIVRFESPEGDSYDRYQPKLHKECAALLQEWADEVLFASYRVYTRKKDEGFGRERTVGTGTGERVLFTSELPAHNAKNRLGLPEEIGFEFSEYAKFLNGSM